MHAPETEMSLNLLRTWNGSGGPGGIDAYSPKVTVILGFIEDAEFCLSGAKDLGILYHTL